MDEVKGLVIKIQEGKYPLSGKIILNGYLDAETASFFTEKVREQVGRGTVLLALDLGSVTFISSAGWGAMVSLYKELQKAKGRLILYDMIPKVERVYKFFDFSEILPVYPDEDAAWKVLGQVQP